MMISNQIEARIEQMNLDEVFSLVDLGFPAEWYDNVRIQLSRMAAKGQIEKVGKGRYYKPRRTIFGSLPPSREEIVKDLLTRDGKPVGYLTGYAVWNQMGLTTQVPNIIEIGCTTRKNKTVRGRYNIRFVLQPNNITRINIPLLQLLDALRFIKSIPDTTVSDTLARLYPMFRALTDRDVAILVNLSLKYPPQTRALVGCLLEPRLTESQILKLRRTLNPLTVFKLGVEEGVVGNKKNWRVE